MSKNLFGVKTHIPEIHPDNRGRVFEIFNGLDDYWDAPLVYAYMFSIRAYMAKGWGRHKERIDRYTLVKGEATLVLYDARESSPTFGEHQVIYLSEQKVRQVTIPNGLWHITLNSSTEETFLVNHPTIPYNHVTPDKEMVPWNSPLIPVDLSRFFPVQFLGALRQE